MSTYDAKDAEALGVAAFDMMIRTLRKLRDKKVLAPQEGAEIMRQTLQGPILPGTDFRLTDAAHKRLENEILSWVQRPKIG